MSRTWRLILSVILLLALPLQGYAAASMFACAATHSQSAVADQPASHDVDSHESHHGMHHASSHDNGKQEARPCGTCAACCIGMTAMPVSPAPRIHLVALTRGPQSDSTPPEALAGRLERPPRFA